MTPLIVAILGAVPLDRDGAREAARRELSKRIYQPRRAGFVERIVEWVLRNIAEAFDKAARVVPGGNTGLVLLGVVAVAAVVLLRLKLGRFRRSDVLTDVRRAKALTADDYRDEAAAFAARGQWREALRARFRAVIRELEQRGVLDERPGRTAGEIASEASAAMPPIGPAMRRAADTFNEVWYGDRPATPAAYDRMVEVDENVRRGKVMAMAAR